MTQTNEHTQNVDSHFSLSAATQADIYLLPQIQELQSIFPNISKTYVGELLSKNPNVQERLDAVIQQLLDQGGNYPLDESEAVPTQDLVSTYIDTSMEVSSVYYQDSLVELRKLFPQAPVALIQSVLKENNNHMYPTYNVLADFFTTKDGMYYFRDLSGPIVPEEVPDIPQEPSSGPFKEELSLVKAEVKIRQSIEEALRNRRQQLKQQMYGDLSGAQSSDAEETSFSMPCQRCHREVGMEEWLECEGCSHLLCPYCAIAQIREGLRRGVLDNSCCQLVEPDSSSASSLPPSTSSSSSHHTVPASPPSDPSSSPSPSSSLPCSGTIPSSFLQQYLPGGDSTRLSDLLQYSELAVLESLGIPLARCPFCPFACQAAEDFDSQMVFCCPNPSCQRISCTKCHKLEHPHSLCPEMLAWAAEHFSSYLTHRLSQADSSPSCPSCHAPPPHHLPLNRILCSCHTQYCFLCGALLNPSSPYEHYADGICPLFGNTTSSHTVRKEALQQRAEHEWKTVHPDFASVDLSALAASNPPPPPSSSSSTSSPSPSSSSIPSSS